MKLKLMAEDSLATMHLISRHQKDNLANAGEQQPLSLSWQSSAPAERMSDAEWFEGRAARCST